MAMEMAPSFNLSTMHINIKMNNQNSLLEMLTVIKFNFAKVQYLQVCWYSPGGRPNAYHVNHVTYTTSLLHQHHKLHVYLSIHCL